MPAQNRYLPWVIALATLVIYLCFPTKNYYWDGVAFALDIEAAGRLRASLLHQNHLVYDVLGYLAYKLARLAGAQLRAVEVLTAINSVLSAACAFVMFHVLRRSFKSDYLSAVLTLLFAFAATWWKFSTDVASYVPSTLLLLLCFYLLLPAGRPRPFAVAVLHAASMILHQLAVFFYPAAVAGLLLQTAAFDPGRRISAVLKYSVVAALLTLGAYYYGFYLLAGTPDPAAFVKWVSTYSSGEGGFTFDAVRNLTASVRGHVRLFGGGRFKLLRDFINPFTVALGVLLVVSFAGLCVQLVRHRGDFKTFAASAPLRGLRRTPGVLALVWALPYVLFIFFFFPEHTFHRLSYFPALIVLIGAAFANYEARPERRRRWRMALFVAVLALSNFLFYTYPYAHVRKDTPLSLALELRRAWPAGTVVLYDFFNSDDDILRYFNTDVTWQRLGSVSTAELDVELRQVYDGGGTVWVETTAIDRITRLEGGAAWLAAHASGQPTYELTDPAYKLKVMKLAPRP
ncbi:MAG TPA: hypothetical protein VF546_07130 [Pyrinomonadaceae bacterium]|jgi:putative effector of murein hydrolase LrgA (UPF0299 family)